MLTCRLCSQEKKLVKSHILPQAFWRKAGAGIDVPLLLTKKHGVHPKRAPIGVYDRAILCGECESLFQQVDDYGARVLLNDFTSFFMPAMERGRLMGFESTSVDQALLLRFFVSVAWRASVSSHPFFAAVDLGVLLAEAAQVVRDPHRPLSLDNFSCIVTVRRPEAWSAEVATTLISPLRRTWEGATVYNLPFGQWVVWMRVGQPRLPELAESVALLANDRLRVLATDFRASKDLQTMIDVVKGTSSAYS
jgi:hypothetical protein